MADEPYVPRQQYTGARAFAAEGARVAVTTCMDCGAALLIDPADNDFNVFKAHDDWHRSLDAIHGWANTSAGQAEVTVRRQK